MQFLVIYVLCDFFFKINFFVLFIMLIGSEQGNGLNVNSWIVMEIQCRCIRF